MAAKDFQQEDWGKSEIRFGPISSNYFQARFFLIWMELLLLKTFIAFFLAFSLFFAFLLFVRFSYLIINNNNSKLLQQITNLKFEILITKGGSKLFN